MKTTFAVSILALTLAMATSSCTKKNALAPAAPSSPQVAPLAPSGLTAVPLSSTQITLAWSDNADNESGYKIEMSEEGSAFSELTRLGANESNYACLNLVPGHSYTFRVCAFNDVGQSDYSTSTNCLTAPTTISAPTGLMGVFDPRASRINLSWVDNSGGKYRFVVESLSGTSWTEIGLTSVGEVRYSKAVSQQASATSTSYRVRALYNDIQPAVYSAYAGPYRITVPAKPAKPVNVVAVEASRLVRCGNNTFPNLMCPENYIKLTWTNVASNTAEIRVRRSVYAPNSQFGLLETLPELTGSPTTMADNSIASATPSAGTKYVYQIQAFTPDGYSDWSDVATLQF